MPYPVNTNPATLNFAVGDFGGNLSVDIIPVSNPGCNPVTSGGLTHAYTTTVTVTIDVIPLTLEIIDPAPVCSGVPVNITLPAIQKPGNTAGTTLTYWTDAAATIGLPNPSTITTSGTYYIKSTLGTCSIIKPVEVTIAPPIPLPIVSTPLNFCISKPPTSPLTATPSSGLTLNWYGTADVGGTASTTAPTPTLAGTYYVSQTDAVCESNRAAIVVNFVADNGTVISSFICDSNKILPADKNSSVYFDWNQPTTISNRFNYTYTIEGGSPVTGYIPGTGTHLQVFGMIPGQSATIIVTSESNPCTVASNTCSVPCPTPKPTPDFAPITQKYCDGAIIPDFSNTSPNGIKGKWTPDKIVNTAGVTKYTFTPDNLCANTQEVSITVLPNDAPTFTGSNSIKSELCENEVYTLPTESDKPNPINGSWSPYNQVDTSVVGLTPFYTFTPNVGECFNASVLFPPISIDVKPSLTTSFVPILDFCAGTSPAPSFPIVTSVPPNIGGIIGNWVPNTISTVAGLNQKYQFTPTTECATTPPEMIVNVDPSPEPTFSPIVPTDVCEGATILLPDSSNDTPPITGSWSTPTVDPITTIDTSIVGTEFYTFTPDGLQCATAPASIAITVNPSYTLINVDTTVTDAFEDNQIITVVATEAGDYLYQLDSGPLQTSPIFENVSAGTHTITVSDAKGCSTAITESDILVIKHPKYFTPNGDGFNDTWKLSGLSSILITKIYIFDRYGKLLKEIAADGTGWDGTYLGVPVPADDYWFTVDYVENFSPKEFKAHFTLKR
jgi:gliding motility-associated-like protein